MKKLGGKVHYLTLNALSVFFLTGLGLIPFLTKSIPLESVVTILVWIGVVITAQSFSGSSISHFAVALGMIPAIAAWLVSFLQKAFGEPVSTNTSIAGAASAAHHGNGIVKKHHGADLLVVGLGGAGVPSTVGGVAGTSTGTGTTGRGTIVEAPDSTNGNGSLSLESLLARDATAPAPIYLAGVLALRQGYLLTAICWSAIYHFLEQRQFKHASKYAACAAVFCALGLMHAFEVSGSTIKTPESWNGEVGGRGGEANVVHTK